MPSRQPQKYSRKNNSFSQWHTEFATAQQTGQWNQVRTHLAQATARITGQHSPHHRSATGTAGTGTGFGTGAGAGAGNAAGVACSRTSNGYGNSKGYSGSNNSCASSCSSSSDHSVPLSPQSPANCSATAAHLTAATGCTSASLTTHHSKSHPPKKERKTNVSFWQRISLRGGNNHDSNGSLKSPRPQSQQHARPNADKLGLLGQSQVDGNTPLHVILSSPRKTTPPDLVLAVLHAEPRAASRPNAKGRLPLHFAVVHRQDFSIVCSLIDVFPTAISYPDHKGRSPLQYAVDIAKRESLSYQTSNNNKNAASGPPRTYWMPLPDDCDEAAWQEDQSNRWAVVHWLLLSAATHPQTSLSVGGRKPLLVEALLCAASPAVISLLIGASVTLLSFENKATAFAGSTLYTCISRHYPLPILTSLASQCHVDVHKVRDETGMGLVSAQFIAGCFEQVNTTKEWTVSEDFYACLLECMAEGDIGDDPALSDWWRKVEFLLAFCACPAMNHRTRQDSITSSVPVQNTIARKLPYLEHVVTSPTLLPKFETSTFSKDHLLHAALLNIDTPPTVVRILLAMYPRSIRLSDPSTTKGNLLPIHMAAMNRDYVPRNYEIHTIGNETVLDIVLAADRSAVNQRHFGRLPLHFAVESGRMIDSLNPLLAAATNSVQHRTSPHSDEEHANPQLLQRDPKTGLYPFLLAATYPNQSDTDSFRWTCIARNKYSNAVWQGLSDRQKASAVLKVAESEEVARVETIFELLRRQPGAIRVERNGDGNKNQFNSHHRIQKTTARRLSHPQTTGALSRDTTGKGLVASHYISWCFEEVKDKYRGTTWKLNAPRRDLLRQAMRRVSITGGFSLLPSDFGIWWARLVVYIQRACRQQLGHFESLGIPNDQDEYLLHSALSNSDTPPEIIELLIASDTRAASRFVPGSTVLPLHIAAGTLCYTPRSFEQCGQTGLALTLVAFPTAARVTFNGRLPLHIAIVSSKSYSDIESLVREEPRALKIKDPTTGLYPCLLMASRKEYTSDQRSRFQYLARNRFDEKAWFDLTPQARTKQVQLMQREHAMDVLSSIFLLLRQNVAQIRRLAQDDVSESQSAMSGYLSKFSLMSPSLVTRASDASVTTEDSFLVQSKQQVSATDRPQNPSSLMLLLSQHRGNPLTQKDDLFECDASVLSNMDMMSTLSSTIHTNRTSTKLKKTQPVECVEEESINLQSFYGGSEEETSYDDFAEDTEVPSSTTELSDSDDSTVLVDATENNDEATVDFPSDGGETVAFEIPRFPRLTPGKLRDGDGARSSIKLMKKPPQSLLAEIKAHSLSNRESNLKETSDESAYTGTGAIDRNSAKSKFSYKSLRSDEKARIRKSTKMLWMNQDILNTEVDGGDGIQNQDLEQSSVSLSLPSTHNHFQAVSTPPSEFAVHAILQKGGTEMAIPSTKKPEDVSPLSSPSSTARGISNRSEISKWKNRTVLPKQQLSASVMPTASLSSLLGSYEKTDFDEDDPNVVIERDPHISSSIRSFSDHNHNTTKSSQRTVSSIKANSIIKRSSSDIVSQTILSSLLSGLDESSANDDDDDFLHVIKQSGTQFQRPIMRNVSKSNNQPLTNVHTTKNVSEIARTNTTHSPDSADVIMAKDSVAGPIASTRPGNNDTKPSSSRAKLFNKRTMSWEDPKPDDSAIHASTCNEGYKPIMTFNRQFMRWEEKTVECNGIARITAPDNARSQPSVSAPLTDLLQSKAAHLSKTERHANVANKGRSQFRGGSSTMKSSRKKHKRLASVRDASQTLLSCLICNENEREVLMVPCQHLCVCRWCCVRQTDVTHCPLCAGRVTGWMQIF